MDIKDIFGSLELGGSTNTYTHDYYTAEGCETLKTKELIYPEGYFT